MAESLGGSPILIRNGARWFADAANDFTRGRQPRTLVGWNPAGEKLLVTVDGRQPDTSVGMSLAEAADLLLALGATDGINLDGGGSTTFVAGGTVVNTPSDVAVRRGDCEAIQHLASPGQDVIGHVERPVTSALAVVPKNEVSVPTVPATDRGGLRRPGPDLAARPSTDPGSVPGGGVPALVPAPGGGFGERSCRSDRGDRQHRRRRCAGPSWRSAVGRSRTPTTPRPRPPGDGRLNPMYSKGDRPMTRDQLEARLRATEIALDCLLAEIDELRDRLEAHARICPNDEITLD